MVEVDHHQHHSHSSDNSQRTDATSERDAQEVADGGDDDDDGPQEVWWPVLEDCLGVHKDHREAVAVTLGWG